MREKATMLIGSGALLLALVATAHAAEPCIKTSFKGDASTYNPYLPGWRTGGSALATGGTYNPNEYTAALQLTLAKQYRCGYGSGAICHAIVQAPNGRALTLRINDNGPLVSGRVIDLNEKSMQYLSGGTMGRNSGVLKNVTVTLLCGIEGVRLGPLDEKDREAWASRTFGAPYANVPYNQASPSLLQAGQPTTAGGHPAGTLARPTLAPTPAPAPITSSYPSLQPIPALNIPTASSSAEDAIDSRPPSKAVTDLLNSLAGPATYPGAFSVKSPLKLSEAVSSNVANLSGAKPAAESIGTSDVSAESPSANTFPASYTSSDLRWSAPTLFAPFWRDVEAMVRSLIDLLRRL